MKQLPKYFEIANNEIKVEVLEHDDTDNNYGTWSDAENTIRIYREVEVNNKRIHLTEEQILNTFYHELMHCFQFYFDNTFSEAQAQSYANFIRSFQKTVKYFD